MNDLISRKQAIEEVKKIFTFGGCYCDVYAVVGMLNGLPSAEPERMTGEWIEWQAPNGIDYGIECSACGYKANAYPGYGSAFCPHCGAEMKKFALIAGEEMKK